MKRKSLLKEFVGLQEGKEVVATLNNLKLDFHNVVDKKVDPATKSETLSFEITTSSGNATILISSAQNPQDSKIVEANFLKDLRKLASAFDNGLGVIYKKYGFQIQKPGASMEQPVRPAQQPARPTHQPLPQQPTL